MGMQCHFDIQEVRDLGYECVTPHYDANCMLVTAKGSTSPLYYFNCSDNVMDTQVWFDIGSMSETAMEKLKWLIANRICFTCS